MLEKMARLKRESSNSLIEALAEWTPLINSLGGTGGLCETEGKSATDQLGWAKPSLSHLPETGSC